VLPETTEEELQEAVYGIPADPEKAKLAAFLTGVLQRVQAVSTSQWAMLSSSSGWPSGEPQRGRRGGTRLRGGV